MKKATRPASAEVRIGTAIRTAAVCLLIVVAAVGYVRQSHEISRLKIEIGQKDQEWWLLRMHNAEKRREESIRRTFDNLQREVKRHGLDLQEAQLGQVVQLEEPILERERRPANGSARLAARRTTP